jgi:hypothetical protein
MNGLMLHSGGEYVSREQVFATATPEQTETWHPIPHGNLIERIEFALAQSGLKVVDQAHGLRNEGAEYFGVMDVERIETIDAIETSLNLPATREYIRTIGIRNAHNKRFIASVGVGAHVFVCDNLSFSAEIFFGRKHTVNIERDLPVLVGRTIGSLAEKWNDQDRRFEAYKTFELTPSLVNDLLIRALDLGVIGATYIPKVLAEFRNPSYPEFEKEGKTAWRLFNAFTTVLKDTSLAALPVRTRALHGMLDGQVGILTSEAETVVQ